MSERFAKIVLLISVTVAVLIGTILTVTGGIIEGWPGVCIMLGGQGVFILLLYLYNRKFR